MAAPSQEERALQAAEKVSSELRAAWLAFNECPSVDEAWMRKALHLIFLGQKLARNYPKRAFEFIEHGYSWVIVGNPKFGDLVEHLPVALRDLSISSKPPSLLPSTEANQPITHSSKKRSPTACPPTLELSPRVCTSDFHYL
jgi:hypothetical protein